MSINGIKRQNGPWYDVTYRVTDASGAEIGNPGMADWADWDKTKDLLFARSGCLFRQTFSKTSASPPQLLADFSSHKFMAIEPPEWARKL
jgi:hypothetical protein